MASLAEKACKNVVVHEIPGIARCFPLAKESEEDESVSFDLLFLYLYNMYFTIVIIIYSYIILEFSFLIYFSKSFSFL